MVTFLRVMSWHSTNVPSESKLNKKKEKKKREGGGEEGRGGGAF
jgi:hypothetical protein